MLKATVLGFVIGEIGYVVKSFFQILISKIEASSWQNYATAVECLLLIALLFLCFCRYWLGAAARIAASNRYDLLISLVLGVLIAIVFPPIGFTRYSETFEHLSPNQFVVTLAVPLCLMFVLIAGALTRAYRAGPAKMTPFFVSDLEKQLVEDDLLNIADAAKRFSERVLNGNSSESIVFGVDAPWGAGKSTFINFCISDWNTKKNVIIFRFNPIQYEDRSHLLNKFVDGLVLTLREHVFIPELRTIVSRYSNLISGQRKFSIAGFDFDLHQPAITVDAAASSIRYVLSNLGHRLIVIVDDLDRMEFAALKDMLFVIKKGFFLPNVSFVLCYDTQNIAALEAASYDNEKISEFLEKFVNVKVGLYPSSGDLKGYVTENLRRALAGNLKTDFQLLDDVLNGVREIYDSEEYHRYLSFLGDVRKIKRLVNTLVLLNIDKTDFKNTDLLPRDLIHLLLIYLNHPGMFRIIYNAETHGRSGMFSVIREYKDNRPEYANSKAYAELTSKLTEEGRQNERFLLDKVFDIDTRLDSKESSGISEAARRSYACFNSDIVGGRNLETYLNLIVRVTAPQVEEEYRFYSNTKDRIRDGEAISKVLAEVDFSFERSETSHNELWRVLINSLGEFDHASISLLIDHAVTTISNYSALEISDLGIGMRHSTMPYNILKLLDLAGWRDIAGGHRNNSDENIIEIADWIFGTGTHTSQGILSRLTDPSRGILGWHDAMVFRLYSCVDRNSSLFNLQRALTRRADPTAPVTGVTIQLVVPEMRMISQEIFRRFKEQYINSRRNLFREVDELSLDDLTGKYRLYVNSEMAAGRVSAVEIHGLALACKTAIKSFTVYQLTNKLISSGIGCGFYDETGDGDGAGILKAMNDYLFDICFDAKDSDGFRSFIEYLLAGFERLFDTADGRTHQPNIDSITTVLDRARLTQYWTDYGEAITACKFEELQTEICTPNYKQPYSEGVPMIIETLNTLLS
ncbi:MAG TPA: P-loop NTPase fold protein [Stellaceae bacterium]|nr:P-loop NTPase fold protein [Stellaceae bacterium]